MKRNSYNASFFVGMALLAAINTGCVATRKEINLTAASNFVPSNGVKGAVYIASITDNRDFSKDSSDNATPSLDKDFSKTSKEERATIIGRQSGNFGIRWANITLPHGETVMGKMRELVEVSLRRAGYQPSNDTSSPIRADVSITDFWTWLSAGLAFNFGADVGAKLKVSMPDGKKITIAAKGHGDNVGHIVKTENFSQALEPAIAEFENKLASELDQVPGANLVRPTAQATGNSKYADIKELYELLKSGAISQQDYDDAKKKALAR